ncbi:MAG: CHRD domain-containing protein [Chloroflexales bacterium]|nr:CHRD domain-containing protein [Chloroflexales bacterium]
MSRRSLAPLTLLFLLGLGWAALAAPDASGRQAPQAARYIVELAGPTLGGAPAPAALRRIEESQAVGLAAIAGAIDAPVVPDYIYSHALNGFALNLTPAQAAQVAATPGVAHVQREWFETPQTDTSPAFIGAAQATTLRAALFYAELTGAQAVPPAGTGATGRAVARYDAASKTLSLQIFYAGLSGPPTSAAIREGAPGEVGASIYSLAGDAVGAPATDGGYIGTTAPLSTAAEASLFARRLFITIATAAAPGGELRGQLVPSRGEGVVIGVLDSGIDPAHPSFKDPAPGDGYDHSNPRADGSYLGVCNPNDGDGRYDPGFQCNDKLIGAYTFAETSGVPDPQGRPSPRDNLGHGSHVAGTAAGNLVGGAPVDGGGSGIIAGVAPHANLIVYDVCGIVGNGESCPGAAILAALDQAIVDGVDMISYSLASSATEDPWRYPEARDLLANRGVRTLRPRFGRPRTPR